jgi:hypothetical protein
VGTPVRALLGALLRALVVALVFLSCVCGGMLCDAKELIHGLIGFIPREAGCCVMLSRFCRSAVTTVAVLCHVVAAAVLCDVRRKRRTGCGCWT